MALAIFGEPLDISATPPLPEAVGFIPLPHSGLVALGDLTHGGGDDATVT
jgi:hypothetical protein